MSNVTRITLLNRLRDTTGGSAWAEFAQVYDALILNWLQQQQVQDADAEDVRQEVMATVFKEIEGFEHNGRPGAFRNWLRKITSNRLHRVWQKRDRRGVKDAANLSQLGEELADDTSRLTLIWEKQHNRYVIRHLLGELSKRFSNNSIAAFRRITLEEESAKLVAEDLEMTLGAVRVAQHRVLKALKEIGAGLID